MKKIILSAFLMAGMLTANGQDLPAPSPTSTVQQRVGLTDVTVVYSRPGVKDRDVFGDLVPYGKLWRTGANMNTTIEFSTDVKIADQTLPAGKYSLFTIPSSDNWTVIFNSKTDHGGTVGYSEENDVLRTTVKPVPTEMTESFTIDINDIANESAAIVLKWHKTKVVIPFSFDVKDVAIANIDKALAEGDEKGKWRVYRNAANYYYNNKMDMDRALDYMDKSIDGNKDSWYSYYLRAEILAEKKMYKEAIKSAETAKEVGMKSAKTDGTDFGYNDMIDNAIKGWKAMKK
jgi:hypothetical protein